MCGKFVDKVKLKCVEMIEKARQKKLGVLISSLYSFAWAVCKIVFGAITLSYFFCVSGVSTLLIGVVKRIYLKNYKNQSINEKKQKSALIAILIIISSVLFVLCMAKYFFETDVGQYGLILSITIATFSFVELGVAVYSFYKAKKADDILLQSFKGCSLVSGCFAISLTQVALLSATKTQANLFNGITGVALGTVAILIGVYLLIKTKK